MRLGFLGTGDLAATLVRGLKGQDHQILVSPRNARVAAALAQETPGLTVASNEEVVAGSDVVFLCLMARVADAVLPGLPFRAEQTILSMMVDAPLAKLRRLCAPATDIAIAIGSPAIAQGGCPVPVYPASPVFNDLYGARNLVLPQPSEAALNAHLGASAICSPILDQLLAATDWLTAHTGNPVASEAYVTGLIRACLPDHTAGGEIAATLQSLSTEGGLNATLRAAMQPAKDGLRNGLDGFHARLGLNDKTEGWT